ncbi:sugar transferase [Romboutsia lituseburensis]|uniref:Sugar transferase involved in LPS biosynthesis (Colanic, teichoic acid) n=1 Tax=Romboutsia lituseburensis DSM 797 TaxID=1121325 RepID=A0A1G9IUN8_9FIRM|nr:sugar transferase [Romboutsia lituseburensis]CEH33749.1 Galactosyl transferase CpsE [Romboutsia lituseburensis]SDL28907.1 Sugar transferase involved in LPS biosynthesis (colanic, teichoic acid) [Romboutsia lituseburensis DSM 797]
MKAQLIIKKIFDIISSALGIVILSPLFLIVSILIKLDSPGKVLFIQDRLGKDGKVFKIYKFRTMCDNAINIGNGLFTDEADSRITKIGSFLRKTSIDELPQLFNILKGDMSLVGPRPPVPNFPYKYDEYSEVQKIRFEMLPGITGWAQVVGRNSIDWDERITLDIDYVKNYSFLWDIKIIILTLAKVVKREDIYK